MILIVGGGVFGQVIAAKLRKEGHAVTIFDRREKEAGSLPSGGHIKPSWMTSITKQELARSLELLDAFYGVQHLQCVVGIPPRFTKTTELLRVDVERILSSPVVESNVTRVGDGWLEVGGERLTGTVIVAAGVWSKQLLPATCAGKTLVGKKGVSFIFHHKQPMENQNMIYPYLPHKQLVRSEHGPGRTWIGDGSAILPAHWSEEREQKIFSRILPHAPANYTKLERRHGLRPYMNGGFQQITPKLWLATGGAKDGTVLAGVYANKLAEALR